jgi:hypothetical protein
MKWIEKIFYSLLQAFLIAIFNAMIITKFLSDEDVENLVRETAERSVLKPAMLLLDMIEQSSKKENFDHSDKTEKNKLLEAYKKYITSLVTEFCFGSVWNKPLATKISDRILKEFFRKLSWHFRSAGLEFSPEVPSI